MRALTIGSLYPPHHLGGYELAWQSWVAHARREGHDVRVLTTDTRLAGGDDGGEPGEADRSLRWYWRDHEFPRFAALGRLRIERHNASALDRRLREYRPDVVVWWPMGGMSLSLLERVRRRGIPAVAVVCDDWLAYGPAVDSWLRAFARRPRLAALAALVPGAVTRVDLAQAAEYLFLSETVRRRAQAAVPGLADGDVVHRGPDADLFRPEPEREWGGRLLYAGRIDPRKGIDLAVTALGELPGAELVVDGAGDHEHLRELEELARRPQLDGRVRFQRSARADLPGVYAEADAVVFPVLWDEPWGLVPLEAMAVGRPVVATGRGGSGEFLRDRENCLLFDPDAGPAALAERVQELAGDPALRERLRRGGFETVAALSAAGFNRRVLATVVRAAGSS